MQAAAHMLQDHLDPQQPLRRLLSTLACESGDLAQSADQLQDLFGQLMADPPVRPGDALEQAQTLDALVQRLQGMASFLSGLSGLELQDLGKDAAHVATGLRLTSQAHRFSPEAVGADTDASAGDCDRICIPRAPERRAAILFNRARHMEDQHQHKDAAATERALLKAVRTLERLVGLGEIAIAGAQTNLLREVIIRVTELRLELAELAEHPRVIGTASEQTAHGVVQSALSVEVVLVNRLSLTKPDGPS